MSFKLMTDNTADLPIQFYDDNDIGVLSLPVQVGDTVYDDYRTTDSKMFFENMRAGTMPTTSQINPDGAKEGFLKVIEGEGIKEILYLAFSSGLSGTYNSVRIAAEELMEERPDVKVVVIDTLCAAMGEGLLVYKANQYKKQGHTLEETAEYVEKIKLNMVHIITVDDLFHLYRGGRINKATAVVGSLVNIKPIIHVDNEGHLVSISNARGRKKSFSKLVEMMETQMGKFASENDVIMINHGDVEEEANLVADMIREKYGFQNIMINCIGATIGAHTGPGLIAIFFMGEER